MLEVVWVVGPVGVVWAVRARGGPGTDWQPLISLETPTKGCRNAGSGVGGGGGGRGVGGEGAARGSGHVVAALKYCINTRKGCRNAGSGVGTHWQPLKTL